MFSSLFIFALLNHPFLLDYIEKCTGTGAGKKKAESKENASLDALIKLKSNSTELESMLKDFGIL